MTLTVYNTLTNQKELFRPNQEGKVTMYLCGPTVYDHAHLGHGRSAVAFDVIRRYLEYVYGAANVTFVTNYTDIDDKMIKRAAEENITVKQLAEKIIPEYEADYGALKIKPATIQTHATDYVDQMIAIVEKLIEKGHAYELDDGVYFEIATFPEYGKLSNQKQDELRAGARIEQDDKKRHPHDFVLWKKANPDEPFDDYWDSPWGPGRPGWHIECSAMSQAELGQPFDIHGGGQDLTFPHHECEIAQSEAAFGVPFCTTWLHNGFITVNKEKMSKSLGNFFTLKDIFKKFKPEVVRYFLLTAHYRSPIEFSEEQLQQAESTLSRLRDFLINLKNYQSDAERHEELPQVTENLFKKVETAMDDDFDTPRALAALFEFIKHINVEMAEKILSTEDAQDILKTIETLDGLLAIMPSIESDISNDIQALIEERETARNNKDWARSDEIRDELLEQGIALDDTPNGTIWKKIN
jgi:cysteinyl-tRNA synthetase